MTTDRQVYRDASASNGGAGHSWANEAFSFTPEEYARLQVMRPDLFDPEIEGREKARRWKAFARSSVGRHFRVR